MKKVFFIAAVVAASIFGVMKATDINTDNISNLQLENIEALADGAEGTACPNGAKQWDNYWFSADHTFLTCHCDYVKGDNPVYGCN